MFDKNILKELNEIKKSLREMSLNFIEMDGWVSARFIQKFLDYSDSNMTSFEKNNNLTISKMGRRKFYRKDEISELIQKHKNK